jgi:hypothetical protein
MAASKTTSKPRAPRTPRTSSKAGSRTSSARGRASGSSSKPNSSRTASAGTANKKKPSSDTSSSELSNKAAQESESTFEKSSEKFSKPGEKSAQDKASSFEKNFWGDTDGKDSPSGPSRTDSQGKSEPGTETAKKSEKPDQSKTQQSGESKDSRTTDALGRQLTDTMRGMAQNNPKGLDAVLTQSFDQASPEQLTQLRESAAKGEISLPKQVSFVDPSELNGAQAAYSPDNEGTVLLSRDLQSKPTELQRAYSEEVGHHFDAGFSKKDSTGDEGQLFQEGLSNGGAVSEQRAKQLKAENDHGTANVNGQKTAVENSRAEDGKTTPTQKAEDLVKQKTEQIQSGSSNLPVSELTDALDPKNGNVKDKELSQAVRQHLAENVNGDSPEELQRLRQTEVIEGRIPPAEGEGGPKTETTPEQRQEFIDRWGDVQERREQALGDFGRAEQQHNNSSERLQSFEKSAMERAGEHKEQLGQAQDRYKELLRKENRTPEEEKQMSELGQKIDKFNTDRDPNKDVYGRPRSSFTGRAQDEFRAEQNRDQKADALATANSEEETLRKSFDNLSTDQQQQVGRELRTQQFQQQVKENRWEAVREAQEAIKNGDPFALEALESLPPDALTNMDRESLYQAAQDTFTQSQDPEVRKRLAPYALEADGYNSKPDPAAMSEALALTRERAAEGDQAAINALAKFSHNKAELKGIKGNFEGREEMRAQASEQLRELIQNGHGSEVNDAMLRALELQPHDGVGSDSFFNNDSLTLLGESGATLDKDDPNNQKTRDVLRDFLTDERFKETWQDPKGEQRMAALKGLDAMSAHLSREDMSVVGEYAANPHAELGTQANSTFVKSLQNFDPQARQEMARGVIDKMQTNLETEIREKHRGSYDWDGRRDKEKAFSGKVGQLGEYMNSDDMKKLAASRDISSDARASALSGVVANENASTEVKDDAIRQMAENNIRPNGEDLSKLVDHVQGTNNPELKNLMLSKIVRQAPDLSGMPAEVGQEIMQRMAKIGLIQYAQYGDNPDNGLAQLGKLIKARQLAATDEFKGLVDTAELDRRIQSLIQNNSHVRGVFEDTSKTVTDSWRNSKEGQSAARQQMDWLQSPDFQARLRLASPDEKKALMNQELMKVQAFAPDKLNQAQKVLGSQLMADAATNPLAGMNDLPPAERQSRLQEYLGSAFGNGQLTYKYAVKGFVEELAADLGQLKNGGDVSKLQERMLQVAKKHGLDESALQKLTDGRLNSVMMGLGIYNLTRDMQNGMPQDFDSAMKVAGDLNRIIGNTPGTMKFGAKLLGLSDEAGSLVAKSGMLQGLTKGLKWAGPAADVFGTIQDTRAGLDRFKAGDTTAGTMYMAAAGMGAGSAALGTMALLGIASGPVGWAALGLSLGAVGASFAASMLSESEELGMLRSVNSWTPLGAAHYGSKGIFDDRKLLGTLDKLSPAEMSRLERVYQERFGTSLRSRLNKSWIIDRGMRVNSPFLAWLAG